jgi:hypothetical protein
VAMLNSLSRLNDVILRLAANLLSLSSVSVVLVNNLCCATLNPVCMLIYVVVA